MRKCSCRQCGNVIVARQLQEDVGDLQQIVKGLEVVRADAVRMRQVQAAILLGVEALVFNLPSVASSLFCDCHDIVKRNLPGGDPGEEAGLSVAGFDALDGAEAMGMAFVVEVIDVVDPAVMLPGAVGKLYVVAVFGAQFQQALELVPQRGRTAGLEGQHVGPVVLLADAQHRSTAQQGVAADAQRGLREGTFEFRGQTGKSLQLAILLDRLVVLERSLLRQGLLLPGVFDELGGHRQSQPAGMDQLGLQHGVQVQRAVVVFLGQAVGAVLAVEMQESGTVHGNHEPPEQSAGVQDAHADEPLHDPCAQSCQGGRTDMPEEVRERLIGGQRILFGAGQAVEVLQDRQFWVTQHEIQLPAAGQLETEQQQAPPEQELLVVTDQGREARIG